MRPQLYIIHFIILGLLSCSNGNIQTNNSNHYIDSIIKIEMNLSAFGVESDSFPSIDVVIDFAKDTSICVKSFYNPDYKALTYSLSKREMNSILALLQNTDLEKMKKKYTVDLTDQPTSTTKIYTNKKVYVIDDYGVEGDYPLQDLYKIVYQY